MVIFFFYKSREKVGILIVPAILQETNVPVSCQNDVKITQEVLETITYFSLLITVVWFLIYP